MHWSGVTAIGAKSAANKRVCPAMAGGLIEDFGIGGFALRKKEIFIIITFFHGYTRVAPEFLFQKPEIALFGFKNFDINN